jgi:hypothetical protein
MGIPDGIQLPAGDWQEIAGSKADWDRDRQALLDLSEEFLARAQALEERGSQSGRTGTRAA